MWQRALIHGMVRRIVPLVVLGALGATAVVAQGPPRKPSVLGEGTYCYITLGMWRENCEILDRKIRALDRLHQLPDSFLVVEQRLNQALQEWQDSVMVAYQTDVKTYLRYGAANREVIEKLMDEHAYRAKLDSLRARQTSLDAAFQQRILGYNIPR